jgi:hypothetical protein
VVLGAWWGVCIDGGSSSMVGRTHRWSIIFGGSKVSGCRWPVLVVDEKSEVVAVVALLVT